MSKVEVVTSVQRRRRFSDEEKLVILEEARQPENNMLKTARKYGVSNGLLYEWQKKLKAAKSKSLAETPPDLAVSSQFVRLNPPLLTEQIQVIRLCFPDGLTVELSLDIGLKKLAELIRALR